MATELLPSANKRRSDKIKQPII